MKISSLPFALIGLASFALAQQPPQTLPNAPGKEVLDRVCGSCHGAEIVLGYQHSRQEWGDIIVEMVSRGAQGTPDDLNAIADYLAKYFGKAAPITKVNVNQAAAKDIQTGLELTQQEAESIVAYRGKNPAFQSLDDLKKVPGLDAAKLDAKKDRISF